MRTSKDVRTDFRIETRLPGVDTSNKTQMKMTFKEAATNDRNNLNRTIAQVRKKNMALDQRRWKPLGCCWKDKNKNFNFNTIDLTEAQPSPSQQAGAETKDLYRDSQETETAPPQSQMFTDQCSQCRIQTGVDPSTPSTAVLLVQLNSNELEHADPSFIKVEPLFVKFLSSQGKGVARNLYLSTTLRVNLNMKLFLTLEPTSPWCPPKCSKPFRPQLTIPVGTLSCCPVLSAFTRMLWRARPWPTWRTYG